MGAAYTLFALPAAGRVPAVTFVPAAVSLVVVAVLAPGWVVAASASGMLTLDPAAVSVTRVPAAARCSLLVPTAVGMASSPTVQTPATMILAFDHMSPHCSQDTGRR
ncbi:hypothetical protein GCM10022226_08370 [Sphaerisporangium flaviroseum]|uniref:Uncharacterized protein n=1 Tax=Sphaerisporangium flaviroseum TaxID=509199 RepID=A0ABP7HFQ4_9ACTN